MPRISPVYTNFTSGELSPRLEGRVDFAKYYNGVKTLENFIVLPHGGVKRRAGTHHVAEVKDSTKSTRLIPFEFNTDQAYIIEMGDTYFRFFKDNGVINEATQVITGITQASPAVVTIAGHPYSNGDVVDIASITGMTELNGKRFTVANKATDTFELTGEDSTAYTAYSSGGTAARVYEIATPYLEADLFQVQFVQSADTMYFVHPSYAPRKLTRTGHTSWTLTTVTFIDGPYQDDNITATTMNPSVSTGTGTLTASVAYFNANMVGGYFKLHGGYALVTAYTSTTVVDITIQATLSATTATTVWAEGSWSDYRGYPAAIVFYEQRLMFAGSTNQPQTIWGSVSADFENMKAGVETDDAIIYTIASNKVNVIRWLASAGRLIVGTAGGEFTVTSTSDAPLSPSNVSVKKQTSYGSSSIPPIQIRNIVIFVQRAGRKLREFFFRFEQDSYVAPDITILSEHITKPSITSLDYKQESDSLVWAVRSDGKLLSMTYERDQDVIAWARQIFGGSFGTGNAVCESIASIPIADRDQSWVITKRTINDATVRYVEYMDEKQWDGATSFQWDDLNTDSALTYDGSAITTVTGLNHLEGETVKIIADGSLHPDKTVVSGSVTLDRSASEIEVGLSYTSTLKTLRPDIQQPLNTIQGKSKRWNEVIVRFHETLGGKINGDPIDYRTSADEMDQAPALFTGDKRISNLGYDKEGQNTITQDTPLPMSIIMITGTLGVFD